MQETFCARHTHARARTHAHPPTHPPMKTPILKFKYKKHFVLGGGVLFTFSIQLFRNISMM